MDAAPDGYTPWRHFSSMFSKRRCALDNDNVATVNFWRHALLATLDAMSRSTPLSVLRRASHFVIASP